MMRSVSVTKQYSLQKVTILDETAYYTYYSNTNSNAAYIMIEGFSQFGHLPKV